MPRGSVDHLSAANERRAREAEEKIARALGEFAAEGRKASFYGVAKRSGVSRGALYANERLRALVETARDCGQPAGPVRSYENLLFENVQLKARIAQLEKRTAPCDGFSVRAANVLAFSATWRRGADGGLEVDFVPLAS